MSMTTYIFAIDPSVMSLGWSVVDPADGTIATAGAIVQKTHHSVDYRRRAHAMAHIVDHTIAHQIAFGLPYRLAVVIETPSNWFTPRAIKSKDSEAVQRLYFMTGCLVGRLASNDDVDSIWGVYPKWKGQTPKAIMKRRALNRLQQAGRHVTPSMTHDTAEAILLGLYAAERTTDNRLHTSFDPPIELICRTNELDTTCTFDVDEIPD